MNSAEQGPEVARRLGLEPLEPEGGQFRRIYSGHHVTAIHYLVHGGEFSALHRMRTSDELFFFHAGAPLRLLLLDPAAPREIILGPQVAAGHRPMLTVPAGVWQGARSTGEWSLVSTVVVPGFEWTDFELATRAHITDLTDKFPAYAPAIERLSRPSTSA